MGFELKKFKCGQILMKNFFTSSTLKFQPGSNTSNFHNVFLHPTMYNHNLHYLRQLDNSFSHRSNKTSCIRFRKDFDFWFHLGVSLFSVYGLDIWRNLLLLIKILITKVELFFLLHVWLVFEKGCDKMKHANYSFY